MNGLEGLDGGIFFARCNIARERVGDVLLDERVPSQLREHNWFGTYIASVEDGAFRSLDEIPTQL